MKRLKKALPRCILALLVATVLLFLSGYLRASWLCGEIRKGNEINTSFSNGLTAPRFLDEVASIMQCDGPKIPLVEACYYRNIQAVEVLLENGADPNFFLEGRLSPLEAAVWYGPVDETSYKIVKLLVSAGADVDLHASRESVVYQVASKISISSDSYWLEQVLFCLLDQGADRSQREPFDEVFHCVVCSTKVELARSLIDKYGCDPTAPGYMGRNALSTLLAYARESSRHEVPTVEMVQMLLDYGVDPYQKDDNGKTAVDYAIELNNAEILSLLDGMEQGM